MQEWVLIMEEFENGFDINIGSVLRMMLEPESEWVEKKSGDVAIVKKLILEEKRVTCYLTKYHLNKTMGIKSFIKKYTPPSIHMEYMGPIEYGATCIGCKRDFQYQKKSANFKCWACKSGY